MQHLTDSDILTIPFPSLIRRIGGEKAKQLKVLGAEYQCELKRVRRSRNWQLSGQIAHLDAFSLSLQDQEVVADCPFFAEKIQQSIQPYQQASLPERLADLINNDPTITLAQLMEKTGCTIAQARIAREDVEF